MNPPSSAVATDELKIGGSEHDEQKDQTQGSCCSVYSDALRLCCSKCRGYLKVNSQDTREIRTKQTPFGCWLCLGLWQQEGTITGETENGPTPTKFCLRTALEEACRPYGGIGRTSGNRFSRLPNQTHTVSLSGDICLRYKWLASRSSSSTSIPFSVFLQDLKQHLHSRIKSIVDDNGGESNNNDCNGERDENDESWIRENRQIFEEEEQGCLSIHLLCLPPKDYHMALALNNYMENSAQSSKSKKQRNRYNKRQKCGPFTTQGGDPRLNLEVRLRSNGYEWISQSAAEELSSSLSSSQSSSHTSTSLESIFRTDNTDSNPGMRMEYQVACFRRPMYLYGYYTKSRRDVSQSPFVVLREKTSQPTKADGVNISEEEHGTNTNKEGGSTTSISSTKEAETLGVTSVEQQICGPIQDMLGVSTRNNLSFGESNDANTKNDNLGGGVLYGMIKFHASGREDMDVRMLVRSDSPTCHGRPFCVQVIDALRPIASASQLIRLIETINHTGMEAKTSIVTSSENEERCHKGVCYYGKNPLGVGISPDVFRPVRAAVFSGLQGDTESKTKHYGCFCWSKHDLPFDDTGGNDLTPIIFNDVVFPLTIQQKTPVRVLHRRTNSVRERNILQARATRVDDHHFRLEVSTQAGAYVKEFVHGDFGRTVPSVSSLMGCKTNLLKLDCEGIEIPLSD